MDINFVEQYTGTPPLTQYFGQEKNRVIYITDVKTLASTGS